MIINKKLSLSETENYLILYGFISRSSLQHIKNEEHLFKYVTIDTNGHVHLWIAKPVLINIGNSDLWHEESGPLFVGKTQTWCRIIPTIIEII